MSLLFFVVAVVHVGQINEAARQGLQSITRGASCSVIQLTTSVACRIADRELQIDRKSAKTFITLSFK